MSIRIRILIFIFFYTCAISAQTIKWSQPLQDNKKDPYMQILGSTDDGAFFVLRSNITLANDREHSGFKSRNYLLQYFSPDLVMLWEKDLRTSFEEGHITDVRMINGKVAVTSYISNKKTKTYYFYAQYLNADGKWIGEPMLLDSFSTELMDENNKPGLLTSRDQSQIAFSYRKINKENNSQSLQLILVDSNLSLRYKKEIGIPVSVQLFVPLNYILTDQGSFFILGIHYASEKKVKAPDQCYYELYGYNRPLDRKVNTKIRSDNNFLSDVGITADNMNKSIVVAGFYSDKSVYSVAGIFYYALTEDSLNETRTIQTPFSSSYLQKFITDKKENKELVNYSIDRLNVRKDGGVAIIAESFYETSRSYFDYYMQSFISHNYFHYGNIMVLSVNPDGNILWNDVVTKDQNSVDDNGYLSSYFGAVTGGRLIAIYNKYIEEESSVLITFTDASGEQSTNVLFNELEKVRVIPQSARQVDDETILMPVYKQNKFYIVQLSF